MKCIYDDKKECLIFNDTNNCWYLNVRDCKDAERTRTRIKLAQ